MISHLDLVVIDGDTGNAAAGELRDVAEWAAYATAHVQDIALGANAHFCGEEVFGAFDTFMEGFTLESWSEVEGLVQTVCR